MATSIVARHLLRAAARPRVLSLTRVSGSASCDGTVASSQTTGVAIGAAATTCLAMVSDDVCAGVHGLRGLWHRAFMGYMDDGVGIGGDQCAGDSDEGDMRTAARDILYAKA